MYHGGIYTRVYIGCTMVGMPQGVGVPQGVVGRHIHRWVYLRVYRGRHIYQVVYPGCVPGVYTRVVYPGCVQGCIPQGVYRGVYPGV